MEIVILNDRKPLRVPIFGDVCIGRGRLWHALAFLFDQCGDFRDLHDYLARRTLRVDSKQHILTIQHTSQSRGVVPPTNLAADDGDLVSLATISELNLETRSSVLANSSACRTIIVTKQ